LLVFFLCLAGPCVAGEVREGNPQSVVPSIDVRARYEFADIDGFDASHAATLRARPGLRWDVPGGFLTTFVEGGYNFVAVGDYHGGAPGATPDDPANSTIADPRNAALNQAWVMIGPCDGLSAKLGRQRLIHDDAAFLGNVGWRQNEQTFDAASLTWQPSGAWRVDYAWIGRVNRIFGQKADGIFRSLDTNIHALDATHAMASGIELGASFQYMDFHDTAATGLDNRTLGARASGKSAIADWRADLSWQDRAGPGDANDAWRFRITATRDFGGHRIRAGIEHLDRGFQSPLATLHALNDYADATAGRRAAGTHGGLTDTHLAHTFAMPWGGLELTNKLHAFGDNAVGTGVGAAWDLVLTMPMGNHAKAMLKSMWFDARDARYQDTRRVALQIEVSY
jgi:hypothetical protein